MLAKGLLHRVQGSVGTREAFDRRDRRVIRLGRQHGAGFHGSAVHVHHTASALRRVAADMGSREAEMITQKLHEQGPRLDLGRPRRRGAARSSPRSARSTALIDS